MKNLIETVKVFQRQALKGTVLTKCKILLVAKNIQRRLFPWWHYAVVSLEDENLGLYDIGENPHQQINEMLLQILHLGLFLRTLGKSTKEVLQNLSLAVPRYLPEQGLVYHLLETNQTYVSLPAVFLKNFKQPYDVQFPSDTVWPHESYALPVTYRMKVEKPRCVPIPQSSQLCLSPIPSQFSIISPRQSIFAVRTLSMTK
ncbi:hypothetical protein LSAT2_013475 [Lamellibrachia satsuma]|nr:hypothetical protein LSAT2_013475 [Lamellibrachia satsuma]